MQEIQLYFNVITPFSVQSLAAKVNPVPETEVLDASFDWNVSWNLRIYSEKTRGICFQEMLETLQWCATEKRQEQGVYANLVRELSNTYQLSLLYLTWSTRTVPTPSLHKQHGPEWSCDHACRNHMPGKFTCFHCLTYRISWNMFS